MGEEGQASCEGVENVEAEMMPIVIYQPHGMDGARQASDEEWGKRGSAHRMMSASWNEWDEAGLGREVGEEGQGPSNGISPME